MADVTTMDLPTLLARCRRFQPLYRSTEWLGAAAILRGYLGWPKNAVVPLSISHGVDFGHLNEAADVRTVEPAHWAYNVSIADDAEKVKPSAKIPHPWLLLRRQRPPSPGKGVLVVGPPPGPENDEHLRQEIDRHIGAPVSILVKARGNWKAAVNFWESAGHRTVTAGVGDETFYPNLYDIISQHECVVGSTFSSALVFAAALGRRIELLREYRYRGYETENYTSVADFHSARARGFVQLFAEGPASQVQQESERTLGSELDFSPDGIRDEMARALFRAGSPVNPRLVNERKFGWLWRELALRTGKPGFLSRKPGLRLLRPTKVSVVEINEISVWLEGANSTNFRVTYTDYVRGVTEPGAAVVQY